MRLDAGQASAIAPAFDAPRLRRALLLAAVLLMAALAWPLRDYVTDDTYIHLQYAHHLAAGDGFVFNVGERVYGSTSPLWVILIADLMAMGVDGLLAAKWLGGAATLAALLLWAVLLRRTLVSPWLPLLATLGWAAHAWMLRWSLSGMETPLAAALVLGGLVAFTSVQPWGSRSRLASLLWALASLARPECGLLLVLWGVLRVLERGLVPGVRSVFSGLWPGLLVQGGWLVFAWRYFGSAFPNTLAAKAAGGEGWAYTAEQLLRQGAIVAATDGVLLLVLGVAGVRVLLRGQRPVLRPLERWLPALWLVAVPVLYTARGVPVLSRYLVPLLPVLGWYAWRLLDSMLLTPAVGEGTRQGEAERAAERTGDMQRGGRSALVAGAVVAALVLAQNLWTWQRVVRPQVASFSAGLRTSLVPWGRWFAEHTPVDAVIAAPDIGALGYLSQRRVVDLAGLVTPEMVPVLREMPQEDAIARFEFARFSRPDYVVDRAPRAWDLTARSPWRGALVPLGYASLPNLGVARPDSAVYSFYRIEWATYDSLTSVR